MGTGMKETLKRNERRKMRELLGAEKKIISVQGRGGRDATSISSV